MTRRQRIGYGGAAYFGILAGVTLDCVIVLREAGGALWLCQGFGVLAVTLAGIMCLMVYEVRR